MELNFSNFHHFVISGVSGQITAGLVVAKQDIKPLQAKEGKEDRSILAFTLRDSTGLCNVTCWGTLTFNQQLTLRLEVYSTSVTGPATVYAKLES